MSGEMSKTDAHARDSGAMRRVPYESYVRACILPAHLLPKLQTTCGLLVALKGTLTRSPLIPLRPVIPRIP